MAEDRDAAQARSLLAVLHQEVFEISWKLDIAERRGVRTSVRGGLRDRRDRSALRGDLYEVHRLITGLHHRFPATADSWTVHSPPREPLAAVRRTAQSAV